MKIGKLIMFTALAAMLGGCVVAPRTPYQEPAYYPDQSYSYPDDYYDDYYDTPAYEGYYYVRVIFIGSIPYYVGDDLHIYPIPPRYRSHFARSQFLQRNRRLPPPRFSSRREVRDGYDTSSIVYMNDVPYVVGSDRVAKPLPSHLRPRFRYTPPPAPVRSRTPVQNNSAPAFMRDRQNERMQNMPPAQNNNPPPYRREQNMPPTYGREPQRNMPPAYGREPQRNMPPAYGREREQNTPPAYGREPERNMPPAYGREPQRNDPPPMNPRPPVNNDAPAFMRERREIRQQRQEPRPAAAPRQQERKAPAREKARDKRKENGRDKKDGESDDNGRGRR